MPALGMALRPLGMALRPLGMALRPLGYRWLTPAAKRARAHGVFIAHGGEGSSLRFYCSTTLGTKKGHF